MTIRDFVPDLVLQGIVTDQKVSLNLVFSRGVTNEAFYFLFFLNAREVLMCALAYDWEIFFLFPFFFECTGSVGVRF